MDFLIRSNSRLTFVAAGLSFGLGFAIAQLSHSLPTRAVSTIALSGFLVLVICAVPIVRRAVAGRFDIFEPVVLACAMLAVLCGLRPIITVLTGDYVLVDRFNVEPYFESAVLLGLACTAAFVLAYELTALGYSARRRRRETPVTLRRGAVFIYCFAISAAALVLYALYVKRAGGLGSLLAQRSVELAAQLGNTSEYLSAAPVAIACAGILLVLARKGRVTGLDRVLVLGFALLPSLLFAFLGNRRFIIPCVLLPLVAGYLISGRRPKTSRVLIVAPIVFIVFATIPFARSAGARDQAGGLAPIYRQSFQQPGETVARFANGPDTDMLLYLALQMHYQGGARRYYRGSATFGDFLLAPVPSSIVPNKPMTARNDLLVRLFGAPCTSVGGGLCPDLSVIGTFYQDFWIPGALLGMALLGVGAAALWQRFKVSPGSPYLALLTAVMTVYLPIIIRAGLMPALTWTFYFIVPTVIGIRIARRPLHLRRASTRRSSRTVGAQPGAA